MECFNRGEKFSKDPNKSHSVVKNAIDQIALETSAPMGSPIGISGRQKRKESEKAIARARSEQQTDPGGSAQKHIHLSSSPSPVIPLDKVRNMNSSCGNR